MQYLIALLIALVIGCSNPVDKSNEHIVITNRIDIMYYIEGHDFLLSDSSTIQTDTVFTMLSFESVYLVKTTDNFGNESWFDYVLENDEKMRTMLWYDPYSFEEEKWVCIQDGKLNITGFINSLNYDLIK